jgi:Protein of unknown function (DUF2889)
MISFQRSQLVGAEFIDENTIRFNGIQEDHIYGMEISMEVRINDGRILKINGIMKRYTNFVCPQAVPVLQMAVGRSLREEGWDKQVMREIGRQGCEHFAEIIIECGRCLDQAVRARDLARAFERDPGLNQEEFLDSWVPAF